MKSYLSGNPELKLALNTVFERCRDLYARDVQNTSTNAVTGEVNAKLDEELEL